MRRPPCKYFCGGRWRCRRENQGTAVRREYCCADARNTEIRVEPSKVAELTRVFFSSLRQLPHIALSKSMCIVRRVVRCEVSTGFLCAVCSEVRAGYVVQYRSGVSQRVLPRVEVYGARKRLVSCGIISVFASRPIDAGVLQVLCLFLRREGSHRLI